jgi:hypothetical protein
LVSARSSPLLGERPPLASRAHRLASAIIVLLGASAYEIFTLACLLRFIRIFRADAWTPATYPDDRRKIVDPIMRQVSKARALLVCCDTAWSKPMDRPRGKFARGKFDIKEPARTERLLRAANVANPLTGNGADTLDVIGFALMARAGGWSAAACMFEFVALVGQLTVAIVCSLTPLLPPGSASAEAQLIAILAIQAAVGLHISYHWPSADRLMSGIVASQFLLEAAMSLLLVYQLHNVAVGAFAREFASWAALTAMCLPVVQRLYDATVVPISKACRQEGFSVLAVFFALVGL